MFHNKIQKEYDKVYARREEDKHLYFYFKPEDFKDMKKSAISFKSNKDQTLNGYLLYKSNIDSYKSLVIFLHGAGGGYLSNMTEIHELVAEGYLVMTYDYTGTFSSEGDTLGGFSQPLLDFKAAMEYVRGNSKLKDKNVYLVGHSWGAFTALNSLHFDYPEVKKVVALAPVLSAKDAFKQFVKGLVGIIALPECVKIERANYGNLIDFSAKDIINDPRELFIIASKDDPIISCKNNTEVLQKLNQSSNHKFLIVNHRLHNPNYTKDAANYLDFKFKEFRKEVKEKKLDTFEKQQAYFNAMDFTRATRQDKTVWSEIFKFLGDK